MSSSDPSGAPGAMEASNVAGAASATGAASASGAVHATGASGAAGSVTPAVGPRSSASPSPERTLVILQGVVARDAAGPRGASRGGLQSLSAHLGPGVHVFLGAPEDGTIALCDVLAGVRPALRGVVLIHSENPWLSPPIRSCTGALLAAPDLPEARTVRASIAASLTAAGRSAAEADGVLAALGIGALAGRSTRGLSFAESRAVELALALHVAKTVAMRAAPPVLVLFEPCADVAIPSATRVVDDAIAAVRSTGACVIIATSSAADARRLGDVIWVLHRGAVLRRESGDGRTLAAGEAELAVWLGAEASASASLRALAAAVCAHPSVRAAYWDDPGQRSGRPAVLRVRGADRDACALAVLDAAASAGIAIEAITSSSPDLAAVRSASVAWVQRVRGGARAAATGPARPKPAASPAGNPVPAAAAEQPPGSNIVPEGAPQPSPPGSRLPDGGSEAPPGSSIVPEGGADRPPGSSILPDGGSQGTPGSYLVLEGAEGPGPSGGSAPPAGGATGAAGPPGAGNEPPPRKGGAQ